MNQSHGQVTTHAPHMVRGCALELLPTTQLMSALTVTPAYSTSQPGVVSPCTCSSSARYCSGAYSADMWLCCQQTCNRSCNSPGDSVVPKPAAAAARFVSTSADCNVTHNGKCVESTNFASGGSYDHREACTITVTETASFISTAFDTEAALDIVRYHGEQFTLASKALQVC